MQLTHVEPKRGETNNHSGRNVQMSNRGESQTHWAVKMSHIYVLYHNMQVYSSGINTPSLCLCGIQLYFIFIYIIIKLSSVFVVDRPGT